MYGFEIECDKCSFDYIHGTAYANFAVTECDFLLALGARFDDRVTGKLEEFASDAEVVHMDIDAAELSKNRYPEMSFLGDLRKILLQLLKQIRIHSLKAFPYFTVAWLNRLILWKESYPLIIKSYKSQNLSPQQTISLLGKENQDAFYTTDVGQHQMWAAQLVNCQPKKWITSAGLGTMGFGLPAAIGVKIAHFKQDVICITGDSSFQMNLQELGTIAQYQLDIKIIIINNGWQGMVRQWQESFYGNRFSNSYMRNGMPNFCELAKAYNLYGYSTKKEIELELILKEVKNNRKGTLIDVNVIENENCYPMMAPGKNNSQMIGLEVQDIAFKERNLSSKWVE